MNLIKKIISRTFVNSKGKKVSATSFSKFTPAAKPATPAAKAKPTPIVVPAAKPIQATTAAASPFKKPLTVNQQFEATRKAIVAAIKNGKW